METHEFRPNLEQAIALETSELFCSVFNDRHTALHSTFNNSGRILVEFRLNVGWYSNHVWLNKLAQLVKSSIVWPILNTETEYFTVSELSDVELVFEASGVYKTVFLRKIKHSNQRFF